MNADPYYAVASLTGSPMMNLLGRGRTRDQALTHLSRLHSMGSMECKVLVDLDGLTTGPFESGDLHERRLTELLLTDPVLHAIYEYGRMEGIAEQKRANS